MIGNFLGLNFNCLSSPTIMAPPTIIGASHPWTVSTNTNSNQWLPLVKLALTVIPHGRNRSLVTRPNKCGWATSSRCDSRANRTNQLCQHPSTTLVVTIVKMMSEHLFLNIIPNNFTHNWNRMESLVWSGHQSAMCKYLTWALYCFFFFLSQAWRRLATAHCQSVYWNWLEWIKWAVSYNNF